MIFRRHDVAAVRCWGAETTAAPYPPASWHDRTIGVRIAARYQDLPTLRCLTETVCYIADFRVDEVCDLAIAVDEVAAALVSQAVEGAVLACDFDYDMARMHVTVTTDVTASDAVDEHSFGWYVVSAITDLLSATVGPYDTLVGGYRVAVEFSRSRGEIDDN